MEIVNKDGFTLLELMATLVIAAIVVSVGLPNFRAFVQNNNMTANVTELVSALHYTRSEAIKRGRRITMCKRNQTATNCDVDGNWRDGWIIFVNRDNDAQVGSDDQILRIHQGLAGQQTTLIKNGNTSRISYIGTGESLGTAPTSFTLCDERQLSHEKKYARSIRINNTGRIIAMPASDIRISTPITSC